MVNYNPNAPDVIGNEWVGIVPAPYPMDSGTEKGYRFTTTSSAVANTGQFYLEAEPASVIVSQQVPFIAMYPAGTEANVGEIRSVVAPVSGSALTGTILTVVGAATVTEALASSSDNAYIELTSPGGGGVARLDLSFDVAPLSTELGNKRILNMSILYTATGDWEAANDGAFSTGTGLTATGLGSPGYGAGVLNASRTRIGSDIATLSRISLGEIDFFGPSYVSNDLNANQAYPWRNQGIQRFTAATVGGTRFYISWQIDPTITLAVNYVALEITYCEENRIVYGGNRVGDLMGVPFPDKDYAVPTLNYTILRTASTLVTGSSLPAGDYSITSCIADLGDMFAQFSDINTFASDAGAPTAQALRELYPLPNSTLRGIEVDRALHVGETFEVEESRVLPYIAFAAGLSTSQIATQAYGQQLGAPVYSGSTVTQGWQSTVVDATPYPWVRFWARRFNDDCTGVPPLTATVGTGVASITCADFNALPVIASGWREVTLRFPSPPTLTSPGTIVWSSPAATGSQWQILTEHGQSENISSSYQGLSRSVSYPPATSRLSDDASFMFIQDPPTVTGVGSTLSSVALTPISLSCGQPGNCIPTGMDFTVLTWTPIITSAPSASGTFGYYEIQRMDTVDTDWETIGTVYTVDSGVFADREARVGVLSSYRIRVVTDYAIEGPWSAITTETIPSTNPSLWLFSSNWDLFGTYSWAAPEVGDSQPSFTPAYYEGSSVTYQEMYGRNNRVAFHGTERGGETFPLTLLMNQGVAGPGSLGQRFFDPRSLVWGTIPPYPWTNPYVCVRSGEGDRWYANVEIPGARIDRRRPTYNHIELMNVVVVETLDDPAPFDFGVMSQGVAAGAMGA